MRLLILSVFILSFCALPAHADRDGQRSRLSSKAKSAPLYSGHFGFRIGYVGNGEYADFIDVDGGPSGCLYYDFAGSSRLVAGLSVDVVSVLPEFEDERKLLLGGMLNLKWGHYSAKSGLQFRPVGAVGYGLIQQAWGDQSMYLVLMSFGGELLIRMGPKSALTIDAGLLGSPYGRIEGTSSGAAAFRPQFRFGFFF